MVNCISEQRSKPFFIILFNTSFTNGYRIGRHYIGFLIPINIQIMLYGVCTPFTIHKNRKKTLNSSRTAEVGLEEKSLLRIVMTNLLFYVASWDYERIQRDRVYPLFIDYIVDEKSEALLICVEKMTYGSFIKKEIKIWFPKSGIEGGEGIHTYSEISEIRLKGCFLKKLLKGQYDYEP